MDSAPLLETAILTGRERYTPGFWRLRFESPEIARRARPAQYVALDVPGPFSVRLPLGIWTAEKGEFTLLFREWGERTSRLAQLREGSAISMIGPLGNVFDIPSTMKRATIVSGGIGVVPFWLLTRDLAQRGIETTALLGARTASLLVGSAEIQAFGARVVTCTDDGSHGSKGTVLDLLARTDASDMLYGCGPPGMLRALCAHAAKTGAACRISMEETFGCSLGTCWGCVVRVRRGSKQAVGYPKAATEKREYDFARVCADGTVFDARDVVWAT
jgi:dihydroorotate dehydrogenase electron transfer subunit